MKYVHTNIISRNWRSLAQFYIKVFECRVKPPERSLAGDWLTKGTGVENAKLEGVHLILPGHGDNGPTLEIFQYEKVLNQTAVEPNRRGFGHIAFEVEDVELVLNKLVEHGGTRFGEVVEEAVEGAGHLTFTYARDPEGNLIELQKWG